VDVRGVVDRLRNVLATTLSERQGELIADPDLPTIEADPRQIEQLLQNLLTNAIKFTAPEVKPVVRVGAHRESDGWCLTVTDNGIGIDPRYAERIFKMFQRLHSREAYPGTGIGLAICKKIAERHGGTIWVDPDPEGGSIFHVTISDDRSRQR
jgi:signal transduction histidine kinase